MIRINKLTPPHKLTAFRKYSGSIGGTQGYYELDTDTKNDLRLHLLEETQFRCAYCMQLLTLRSTIIEHIKPYSILTKMESTDYNNLVINCKTTNTPHKYLKSCSDHKSDAILNKVNHLLFSDIEDHISYRYSGEIYSFDPDIENDLKTLNLNNPNLKENRYKVIVKTIEMIKEKRNDNNYTSKMKERYEDYIRKTPFPYPGVVIALFKK